MIMESLDSTAHTATKKAMKIVTGDVMKFRVVGMRFRDLFLDDAKIHSNCENIKWQKGQIASVICQASKMD